MPATKSNVRFAISMAMGMGLACIGAYALLGWMVGDMSGYHSLQYIVPLPATGYWLYLLPKAIRDWQ